VHTNLVEPRRARSARSRVVRGAVAAVAVALAGAGAGWLAAPSLGRLPGLTDGAGASSSFVEALPGPGLQPAVPAQDEAVLVPAQEGGEASPRSVATDDSQADSPQPRSLAVLLAAVAADAGRALVLGPGIDGELRSHRDEAVAWAERLAAYARVYGFVYAVGEDLLEIRRPRGDESPGARLGPGASVTEAGEAPGLPTAVEESAAPGPAARREAAGAALPSEPAPEPEVTRIARLAHADAGEVAKVLARTVARGGARVAAEPGTNAVLLAGVSADVDRLLGLARELDRSRRRVLLEARIVELSRSVRRELGIEWTLGGELGAEVRLAPGGSSGDSAALVVMDGGRVPLEAQLSALESEGRVRVVSRPSVVVLEGSTATIESVRILRIRLPDRGTVVTEDATAASGSGRATEEVPVGVRLEVTPSVRAGRRIHLRIHAKSSSLGPPLPPDGIPEELSRTVDAEIEVAAGTTAVLGGLLREGRSRARAGVPVLRDIPGLGILFRKDDKEADCEELLVLVTPKLIEDETVP
jgi:hypothetical protein